jgi:acetyl esterase/lipase
VARPEHLNRFVVPVEPVEPEREGNVDLYLPATRQPSPAIVFVHGGPIPADRRPTPRDWPVYRGYGSLAATRGAVGVTVDHRLNDVGDYPLAGADVAAAVQAARADPRVDAHRIAVWFFSGGGLLLGEWLRGAPDWLRCVAASYPLLVPLPGWNVDGRFRPVDAIAVARALPIVLTRAGRERPHVADGVEAFVAAARTYGARLEIIEVPHGRHGFDVLDHTDESRTAVEQAIAAVLRALA